MDQSRPENPAPSAVSVPPVRPRAGGRNGAPLFPQLPPLRSNASSHRHSFVAIYLTAFLQGSLSVIYPASGALLRGRLGLSDTLYGALFLPGLGLAIVTSLAGHVLLRRWSLKRLFLFALACQVATALCLALSGLLERAYALPVLVAGMFVSGPAGGMMGIALNSAAVELYPRARSGSLSALHGALGAGATLGPFLVALAIGLGFWAAAPLLVAGALAAMAVFSDLRPVIGIGDARSPEHARAVPRRLVLRSIPAFLYGIGEATFTAWAVIYLRETRGLPMAAAAGALSAFWLAMTVGRFGGVMLLRRVRPLPFALLLSAGMGLSFLLVAGAHDTIDSWLRFGFAGLCCSALFPLLLGLTAAEFPDRTPQVSAVFTASVLIGIAIGCFFAGPLRAWAGLERIYLFSAAGPVLLAAALLALRRGPRAGIPGSDRPADGDAVLE